MKREFWTLFYYGSNETICSKHSSSAAALRAAAKCERMGGSDHRVIEMVEVIPYRPPALQGKGEK